MQLLHFALVMALVAQAISWGEVGHLLVARTAEMTLQKNHPSEYTNFSSIIVALNNLTDGRSNSFVEASLWADDIKNAKATLFDPYHYIDRIYDPDGLMPILKQKNKDINVVNTIGWAMKILKNNRGFISFERALMARFLINLVGEVHQPLNTIQMFNNSKAFQNGDAGGLYINITTVENVTASLHTFLDNGAFELENPSSKIFQRPLNSSSLQLLDEMTRDIMDAYPVSFFNSLATNLNPNTWSIESYNQAIAKVYPFVQNNHAATPAWTAEIAALSKQKIALAGYRLANIIASIYA